MRGLSVHGGKVPVGQPRNSGLLRELPDRPLRLQAGPAHLRQILQEEVQQALQHLQVHRPSLPLLSAQTQPLQHQAAEQVQVRRDHGGTAGQGEATQGTGGKLVQPALQSPHPQQGKQQESQKGLVMYICLRRMHRSEALAVHNVRTSLLVLLFCHPARLESGKRGQDRSSDPH